MQVTNTYIKDLVILEPKVFEDSRGYFFEGYNKQKHNQNGLFHEYIQDNQSKSSYGVVRGLHFQRPPFAQTKLVRVLEGSIFDIAVDIRKNSETYGKWFGIELSADNKKQLLVPQGFAHGFSVLSKTAIVMYKCDNYYNPQSEGGIIFNDSTLNIDWKISSNDMIVSDKDLKLPDFKSLNSVF